LEKVDLRDLEFSSHDWRETWPFKVSVLSKYGASCPSSGDFLRTVLSLQMFT